jgi:putative ABC transport system ATP-binding protein
MASDSLIRLRSVSRRYGEAAAGCTALDHVDLDIARGESVAIVGRSGSGKTTLVNLLAGLDRTSEGSVQIGEVDLGRLSPAQLARWRGREVGIVFQFFQLLPSLTVRENILLAMDFVDVVPRAQRRARADDLLERLDIANEGSRLPQQLSGGQQQRAAIARALANDPPLLIADEPTGNLDSENSTRALDLLAGLAQTGKTVITVSHERDIATHFARIVTLRDGRIADDSGARA